MEVDDDVIRAKLDQRFNVKHIRPVHIIGIRDYTPVNVDGSKRIKPFAYQFKAVAMVEFFRYVEAA
ncbi:hypothetical protein D3C76_790830 [compost metagenome]